MLVKYALGLQPRTISQMPPKVGKPMYHASKCNQQLTAKNENDTKTEANIVTYYHSLSL